MPAGAVRRCIKYKVVNVWENKPATCPQITKSRHQNMIHFQASFVYVYTRMDTNDSEIVSTLSVSQHTVIIVDFILICTCVVGAVGNILIIFVICRTRSLRTAMNANLVSLAVADLIVCFILVPLRLVLYNDIFFDVTNYRALCQIDVFIKTTCDSAQLFMLVATSFERFQSIARPFEKQGHAKRTAISLTVAWLLSLSLGTFNSQYCSDGATVYPCYTQRKNLFPGQWGDKERSITLPLGLLCLLLVIIFYGKIMKLLNEHNTTMQNRFKTFKNKVSPTKKITEKSTSNMILKIHSTVPIEVKQTDKNANPEIPGSHKSQTNVDSGFNENDRPVKSTEQNGLAYSVKEDIIKDNSDHSSTNQILCKDNHRISDIAQTSGDQKISQSNDAHNVLSATAPSQKNDRKPGHSWKKIISNRLFGNASSKPSKADIIQPIRVLKVRETKRFPLIRERVTLAKLETSHAEKLKKLNLRQLRTNIPLRDRLRKVKSASMLHKNERVSQIYNSSAAGSFSCSKLQERGKSSPSPVIKYISNESDNMQETISRTVGIIRSINCETNNQNNKSSEYISGELPSVSSNIRFSEKKDCRTETNKPSTPILEKDNNGIESLEEIKVSGMKKNGPENENGVTSDCVGTIKSKIDPTAISENTNSIKVKSANGALKEETHHQSNNTKMVTNTVTENVVAMDTLKPSPLSRVEVVEMDGTVHKKVKVESGSVVGAVCVMNNSNRVQGRRKVEMRTAKNIAILIGTFILLWLPLPVVVIYFSSRNQIKHVFVEPVLFIASASTLTIALNPILNVLLNKQMRSRTISTLRNCKKVIR